MKLKLSAEGQLRRTIHTLAAGSLVATGFSSGHAIANEEEAVQLDKVEVTGSRIRRVDMETASPVFVIDRSSIESSGVATLGELLQEMPSIAGAATNPSVNNGGGTGSSTVSLRGLGSERTLVLLNGRRLALTPQLDAIDVNAIPVAMIERVEVLKDGASAIYGSDAIGGVVNFITRKDLAGTEILTMYGATTRDDGQQKSLSATFGVPANKGGVLFGIDYNTQKSISSADRPFSERPLALYNGQEITFGSSRVPNGRYVISTAAATAAGIDLNDPSCSVSNDTVAVTRIEGQAGDDSSHYRCYIGGGPGNDTFNFQSDNVVLTPSERWGAFMSGSWQVGNLGLLQDIELYAEGIYRNTTSNFQIAPEPFDGRPAFANVTFSEDSIYNPFGEDITDLRLRLQRVGRRIEEFETNKFHVVAGAKGLIFDEWYWDLYTIQANERQNTQARGELYVPGLQNAVGPSFVDGDGNPTCGTPDAPISNCTPVDFFGEFDPTDANQRAALNQLAPFFHDRHNTEMQMVGLNVAGDLANLPAGPLGVAFGVEHRSEEASSNPDFLRTAGLTSGQMSSPVSGGFDVTEVYAEAAVPLAADMFLIESLEASLGIRYSDYSTFGETTNGKIGLQWRPMDNLLVRTNWAQVFRSPTIIDLFGGDNESAESFTDPCNGETTAVGQNANIDAACQNVARDGSFQQSDSQLRAIVGSNPNLQPEEGEVITAGFVYSAPFGLEPLTIEIDAFQAELSDTIDGVGTQTRLDNCYNLGLFCDSFTRDDSGEIFILSDLTENVGALKSRGVDIGFRYDFGNTSLGRLAWKVDSTWLHSWENERIEGDPSTRVENVGRFSDSAFGGDGHYARWRGLSQLNWGMDKWSATLSNRFIGSVTENPSDFGSPTIDDGNGNMVPNPDFVANRKVGSQLLHDIQISYAMDEHNMKLSFGIDNVTDKLAPILYSGFNGSTDVRTYDGLGSFYWMRAKFSFQ